MAVRIHPDRTGGLTLRFFTFYRLHIPSGKRFEATLPFLSGNLALTAMDSWNAQQPGVWQYWLKPGQPLEGSLTNPQQQED